MTPDLYTDANPILGPILVALLLVPALLAAMGGRR